MDQREQFTSVKAAIRKPVRIVPAGTLETLRDVVDADGWYLGTLDASAAELVVEAVNDFLYDEADAPVEECLHALGPHDCVLDAGHDTPHACDDECDLDHLTVSDLEELAARDAVEAVAR